MKVQNLRGRDAKSLPCEARNFSGKRPRRAKAPRPKGEKFFPADKRQNNQKALCYRYRPNHAKPTQRAFGAPIARRAIFPALRDAMLHATAPNAKTPKPRRVVDDAKITFRHSVKT